METDRFLLRPWRECDAEALFKYASDPDVGPRAGWEPHKSVEESLQIIRTIFGGDHMWAIELKDYCFNEKHLDVLWSDFFIDNPASGRVMGKCGFRETGEMRYCENLYGGCKRPIKVMRLCRNG